MKKFDAISKILLILALYILCFQKASAYEPDISQQLQGKWKYEAHLYRKVGRYGPKEIEPIKSSLLCFTKNKIYFEGISFIDSCSFTKLEPKAFFDRECKESNYFLDGPLAQKYTEKQLSKFVRIDLNCKKNDFGTFFLNADTLILNSYGGVTFFFVKERE